MAKTSFALLLALASISLPARLASADACAAPADVEVVLDPETSCITITDEPACNGGSTLTITNGCASDLLGIERRSTVQNLPEGMPPFDACVAPWQAAKDSGAAPPACVLAPGEKGTSHVWAGDVLELELEGKTLLATTKNVPPNDAVGGLEEGCSMSPGLGPGGRGSVFGLLVGLAALLATRRRSQRP
jgi:MYXO-CTERM domain-containing protein